MLICEFALVSGKIDKHLALDNTKCCLAFLGQVAA